MHCYLELLRDVLENGDVRKDRTGTGTIGVFGRQIRVKMADGFPLLTTKKLHTRSIFHELIWFLKGETNVQYLRENKVAIWDEWADEFGDLGPVYGKQWRQWLSPDGQKIDQISELIFGLKTNPWSRRHLVVAWNPADIGKMALPPCHCLFQFHVLSPAKQAGTASESARPRISLQLYQRSADLFLGVPFNIASYSLLLQMVAQVCDYEPHEFIHTFGDLHLYLNHLEQAKLQISRDPLALPKMTLNPSVTDLFEFKFADFSLEDYNPHPHIPAPISV